MAKKKNRFKGKTGSNSKQNGNRNNFGYLKIPKDVPIYSAKPGKKEKFNILPYIVTDDNHPDLDKDNEVAVKGELWYKRPYMVHRNVGGSNEAVVCLQSFGEKCYICEQRKKRQKEGADKNELDSYKISTRNLYYIEPLENSSFDSEPHIFDISSFCFQDKLDEEILENEENEGFPDLEFGKSLEVRWKKESFQNNTFATASRIDFKKRKPIDESVIEELPSLDEFLIKLSYKEMKAKFNEESIDEDLDDGDEVEDEDNPFEEEKKSKRKKKSNKPKADEKENYDDLSWSDLTDMGDSELSEVIEFYELDSKKFKGDTDLVRKKIAKKLKIQVTEESQPKSKEKSESKKGKEKKSKCPNGHVFGEENDEHDDCEGCSAHKMCEKEWEKIND